MSGPYSQFCYVVHDLDEAIARWVAAVAAGPFYKLDSSMLQQAIYRGRPAKDSFRAAMGFMGSTIIELIQPTNNEPSIFREILDRKGEAVHHIGPSGLAMTPSEYDGELARYVRAGFETAMTAIVPGIGRNAFFDAVDKFGFFIEILELQPETVAMIERMHAEHLAWDRTNPVRVFAELAG